MRFKPRPLAFYVETAPNQDHYHSYLEHLNEEPPPIHSVLEIKTTAGEELIFDGTPEQFGWSDTAWTQDKGEVERYYVEGQTGMWEFPDTEKARLKDIVLESHPQPWGSLYKQMDELLAELDWNTFNGLDEEVLCQTVRDQAQRKFATGYS